MRLISGLARGVPLAVPKQDVRPTPDRVREALFSILIPRLEDAKVLDLFAGTGALGLEALSRGAKSACFVEQNAAVIRVLEANLTKSRLEGGRIMRQDAYRALSHLASSGQRFDLILADPPYTKSSTDLDHAAALFANPALRECLSPDGMLVLEVMSTKQPGSAPSGWTLRDQRDYGTTRLLFLTPEH